MAEIAQAFAFANNEVAFLAWGLDVRTLPGCLGFHVVREYLDDADNVVSERPLASYVAFKGQSNPEWLAQNTSVWPVQKFTWRDLTLRRRRDRAELRPENERVRYRIRAVGRLEDGLEPVETIEEFHVDAETGETVPHTYEGEPIPLGYLTEAKWTNSITVTSSRPPFISTFTNGVLSTQFLVRVLNEDGVVEPGELLHRIEAPGDSLREYLAGDVLEVIRRFFARKKGRFYAALYELEDAELQGLLEENLGRLSLILSDAGSPDDEGNFDSRNTPARAALRKLAKKTKDFEMQDRLFNGSGHIGHNKFVVHVGDDGEPQAVLTGSTNWTSSGVAGQSNNCIVIEDTDVARTFLDYWERLKADKQPTPKPLRSKAVGAGQSDEFKESNKKAPDILNVGSAKVQTWFSPNVPGKNQPPAKTAKTPSPPPPDMSRLFSLMRKAKRAIFFLVFMPSRGGLNSIVSAAVEMAQKDTSLLVTGAISDTQAMWGFQPGTKGDDGSKTRSYSPHVFQQGNISVVRASALADKKIVQDLGDFQFAEILTTGKAIIHDKVMVIDPMDPENCVVAFGSHNLGYKASYSNDENLVIVQGHQDLALAYAAHVMDVYDHYRFRAIEMGRRKKDKSVGKNKKWDGFLSIEERWQDKASRRLARYFTS
jgi:phosphatidylserine/phosphatidylglycerophosphate/cardiolipin synthase-like enzyme